MLRAALLTVSLLAATSTQVHSEQSLEHTTAGRTEVYCARWASNGMTGAAQGLRGKPLKFIYLSTQSITQMIMHGNTDVDGIVFIEDEYAADERSFLEASVSEGWRWAQDHLDRSRQLPGYGETLEQFYEGCMARNDAEPRTIAAQRQ